MNILTPIPAERLELKGLKSLKLSYPFPDSKKESAKIEALGFRVMGYRSSKVNLLYNSEPSLLESDWFL
jgi:hypothetical protein